MIEFNFDMICRDIDTAKQLKIWVNRHFHVAHLRKESFYRDDYDTDYRGDKKTKSRFNRIYNRRIDDSNAGDEQLVARLEFVYHRPWIKAHTIIHPIDCFTIDPLLVIKGSSFRNFDLNMIERKLKRSYSSNLVSRYMNEIKKTLEAKG